MADSGMFSTFFMIEIDNNYQLDLRNSEFSDVSGFEEKIVNETEYGSRLPNITNSKDMIHINTDAITNYIFKRCQYRYNRRYSNS